jgi:hypothetical protein
MDGKKKLQLIYEFLLEKGYRESAATLRKETYVVLFEVFRLSREP